MLNRWIETEGLLDAAAELGIGVIGFTALAQGLLTDRYLDGIPEDSRAARGDTTFDTILAQRRDDRAAAGAERDRRPPRPDASPSSRSPGRCATSASPRS